MVNYEDYLKIIEAGEDLKIIENVNILFKYDTKKDGLIFVRRGTERLRISNYENAHFSSVRMMIDTKHYISGMAVYVSDDMLPPPTDIIVHTNNSLCSVVKNFDPTLLKGWVNIPGSYFYELKPMSINFELGKNMEGIVAEKNRIIELTDSEWTRIQKEAI